MAAGQRRERLLTSSHVGETWTILCRRLGHAAGLGFLDRLKALPNLEIAHADEVLEADAWAWLRRDDDRE